MRKKIAILKLAAIGDVVIACRALLDLSKKLDFSNLDIHWIIDKKLASLAKVLTKDLKISFHFIESQKLLKGKWYQKLLPALNLLAVGWTLNPNFWIILHRDRRYQKLLNALKYFNPARPKFYSITYAEPPKHEIDIYTDALRLVIESITSTRSPLNFPNQKFIPPNKNKKIGILIGGASNQKLLFTEKRWPLKKFEDLVEQILNLPDREILLFGSPEDIPMANSLLENISKKTGQASKPSISNLVGRLSLQEIPEALSSLDYFVSIDSGLAHIAALVMTSHHQKIVTLFGPTNPVVWGPRANENGNTVVVSKNLNCSPCYKDNGDFTPCKFSGVQFQQCMTDISVEDVLKELS